MARKVVTVTHPDGTKKVIVGKESTAKPISSDTSKPIVTRETEKDRRPKPIVTKAGLTSTRTAYKNGGQFKFKPKNK